MDYANPMRITYTKEGIDFTSSANVDMRIAGPYGMVGRVVAVALVVTTAVTVAASALTVGTAADPDAYASLAVPVSSQYDVLNNPTLSNSDANLITANTRVEIGNAGGSTAGAGTVSVTIDWFQAA